MDDRRGSGRGAPWFSTELGARVISGLALALVALVLTAVGGWPFALLWLAAAVVVALEWLAMLRCEPRRHLAVVAAAGLSAFTAACLIGHPLLAAATAAGAVLAVVLIGRTGRDRAWAAAGLAYAAFIAAVPPLVREHPSLGLTGILWMFAVVWATDTAAYFVGRSLGGPKLWAAVSPKKTWSGFVGGLVAGMAGGALTVAGAARLGFEPPVSAGLLLAGSALASALSQLGDLGESALKRAFGAKDSGRLIPGHGGLMDRLDGFWAVAALVGVVLAAGSL